MRNRKGSFLCSLTIAFKARPANLTNMKKNLQQSVISCVMGTVACFCVGCSTEQGIITPQISAPIEVFMNATAQQESSSGTKTFIGGDLLDRVFWSEYDTLSVYWRTSGSANTLNTGQRFHCYRYTPSVSTFATEMEAMGAGSYDYYAAFPKPASISGTQVSYDLPAVQDGTYKMRSSQGSYAGNLDFMIAEPLIGYPELSEDYTMSMNFIHQCHVMRIQVPIGRNLWGHPIRKLRVEFPSPVVGRMTMDLTDPTATPSLSDGGSTVTAELLQSFDESVEDDPDGQYVWIFLCPGTISGPVRFTACDEDGNQLASVSQQIDRTFEAGRITPVNLTIPETLSSTCITFSIIGNNLGENPNSFTVKAPENALFSNGLNTQEFTINDDNRYTLSFYNQTNGINHYELIREEGLTLTYDSENAIVSELVHPDSFAEEDTISVGLTVPYLFFEDFANVIDDSHASEDDGSTAEEMDEAGLPGWTGSRWVTHANTSLELCTSTLHFLVSISSDFSRVDSPPLSGIKPDKAPMLQLLFDCGGSSASSNGTPVCTLGTSTKSGAIAGGSGSSNPPETSIDTFEPTMGGSATVMTEQNREITLNGCTSETRLTWFLDFTNASNSMSTQNFYLYLDNIRVSILQ